MSTAITIPYDIQQAGPEAIAFYHSCIARGESTRLAEMLALRAAPRCFTDSTFAAGHECTLSRQSDDPAMHQIVAMAKKRGYRPNPNDIYLSQLAAYPGDPKAFVPSTDARGHIKKVSEQRGHACDGGVKVKAGPTRERKPAAKLAPDLVEQNVRKMVRKNPDLKRVPKRELQAEATLKHGSQ